MFSLGSPHRGDSNEYKQHTFFNIEKKIIPKMIPNIMSAAIYHGIFPRDSRTSLKFEIAVVNKQSMFEPLMLY